VVDTANFLNLMGARIVGAGTSHIRIDGVPYLGGCVYSVIPDRLVAGAFLMAPAMTGGQVTVSEVIPAHLESCAAKLREAGLTLEVGDQQITSRAEGPMRPVKVRAGMYPEFATDLQQPMTALLTRAWGKSTVTDRVYPERFNHVAQLKRMGADIEIRKDTAVIRGGRPLKGTTVHATDVRAGTCLLLAGLAAEGRTIVTGVEHIERGYENAIGLFRQLGARMSFHHEDTELLRYREYS
jgi:UDP-N-acetylglucosamine 1-carboxyvinyltransferase